MASSLPALALLLANPPPTWEIDSLLRYLEPRLSLIKSRTLNSFYRELQYGTSTSIIEASMFYLPRLVSEATNDYRLERLLLEMLRFSCSSNTL